MKIFEKRLFEWSVVSLMDSLPLFLLCWRGLIDLNIHPLKHYSVLWMTNVIVRTFRCFFLDLTLIIIIINNKVSQINKRKFSGSERNKFIYAFNVLNDWKTRYHSRRYFYCWNNITTSSCEIFTVALKIVVNDIFSWVHAKSELTKRTLLLAKFIDCRQQNNREIIFDKKTNEILFLGDKSSIQS